MKKIVLASHNAGKLREFSQILTEWDYDIVSQKSLQIASAEETGLSFVENAILKARHAAHHSGLPALSDDSGIEVDALNGAPGIYSSRFAGVAADDKQNNTLLLNKLKDITFGDRTARYQCVVVFMRHVNDPTPLIYQGSWEGYIGFEPRGEQGFGYDPLFYLPEQNCTAAELAPKTKNQLSHRGQALRALQQALSTGQLG